MKTFKDIPEIYVERVRFMYKNYAQIVLDCKNLMRSNHLAATCPACSPLQPKAHKTQTPTMYNLDRVYAIPDTPWYRATLRQILASRQPVYTNLEFPTPLLTYRSMRRIPTFYDPYGDTVLDVIGHERFERFGGYFFEYACRKCDQLGLDYTQLSYNPKTKVFDSIRCSRPADKILLHSALSAIKRLNIKVKTKP